MMATKTSIALSFLACSFMLCSPLSTFGIPQKPEDFLPPKPKEVIREEGGSVLVWGSDFEAIQEAEIGACLTTVEPQSLELPHYSDSAKVSYILAGSAVAGLISPLGIPTNVRSLHEGDAFVVPRGWAHWIWNSGQERVRIFSVADTSQGPQTKQYIRFNLIGAAKEKHGGILHGFSKDLLARAWDVEEKDVEQLLSAQKGTEFIKVKSSSSLAGLLTDNGFALSFKYNLRDQEPDLQLEGAGSITQANRFKLPILKRERLAVTRVSLKNGAQLAPHYVHNAALVIHILKGNGRFEIAHPDGRQALSKEVTAGEVILIPALYAHAVLTDENGEIEWVSVATSSLPIPTFLAGATSVYKGIPREILEAGFNVDEHLEDKFYSHRRGRDEIAILRPPGKKDKAMKSRIVGNVGSWEDVAGQPLFSNFEEFMDDINA